MASADELAAWIVKNADKQGTPDFDTVAKAYQEAKGAGGERSFASSLADIPAGLVRGAASIGATLINRPGEGYFERRAANLGQVDEALKSMGASSTWPRFAARRST